MNYIEQGIKVGDKVWTIQEGDTEISDMCSCGCGCITTKGGFIYENDGRHSKRDIAPSLFWSKPYDTLPGKPEPPKYQWLWKRKTVRVWSLSCGYHADEDEFIKHLGLDNRFVDVRKFDLQED